MNMAGNIGSFVTLARLSLSHRLVRIDHALFLHRGRPECPRGAPLVRDDGPIDLFLARIRINHLTLTPQPKE